MRDVAEEAVELPPLDLRAFQAALDRMDATAKRDFESAWGAWRNARMAGYRLDNIPRIPSIHQRVYEAASAPHALEMSQWHVCKTVHCRAGWVVTLAGDPGRELEKSLLDMTDEAALLIYAASDPNIPAMPDFYCEYYDALRQMKNLAELEAAREEAAGQVSTLFEWEQQL